MKTIQLKFQLIARYVLFLHFMWTQTISVIARFVFRMRKWVLLRLKKKLFSLISQISYYCIRRNCEHKNVFAIDANFAILLRKQVVNTNTSTSK
jgi:hypothetical protein